MTDSVGLVIRSYRSHFAINASKLDDYTDWRIESVKAEWIAGRMRFYAHCKQIAWMSNGDYHVLQGNEAVLTPYMDIELFATGVPDSYRLMRKRESWV